MRGTWAADSWLSQIRQVEIRCLFASLFGREELVRQIAVCIDAIVRASLLLQWKREDEGKGHKGYGPQMRIRQLM